MAYYYNGIKKRSIILVNLCLISVLFITGCLSEVDSLANDMEDAWDQVDITLLRLKNKFIWGKLMISLKNI